MSTKLTTSISRHLTPIKNRIQSYSISSSSLALLSGILGQTVISSAAVIDLNLASLIGTTFISTGSGTGGQTAGYSLDASSDSNDYLTFWGRVLSGDQLVIVFGGSGSNIMTTGSNANYYSYGSIVNGNLNSASTNGRLFHSYYGGAVGDWITNRIGAIGFQTGDSQFGFINVDWNVSEKTMTILGGKLETNLNTPIVVTTVPEPAAYAAALGLGALGLAYYRKLRKTS